MKNRFLLKILAFVLSAAMLCAALPALASGVQPVVVRIGNAENLPLWFRHWYLEDDPDTMLVFDAFYGDTGHMKLHWQGYGDIDCCPVFGSGDFAEFTAYITYVGGTDRRYDLFHGTISLSTGTQDGRDRLVITIGDGSIRDPRSPFYADLEGMAWTFTFVTDETAEPLEEIDFQDFFGDGEPEGDPGDVPEIGSGVDDLFGDTGVYDLSELDGIELLAAAGAGAWGGSLMFDGNGHFRCLYSDTDDMTMYWVVFYGRLTNGVKISDTSYRFTVTDVTTEDTPGTTLENNDYGGTTVYIDPLFPEGSTVLLTLPGAPEDEIPEMVQMEFYGCYPGAYICDFITLTDESGWGFFEMPEIDMP